MIDERNLAADIAKIVDVLVSPIDQLTRDYLMDAYTDYSTGKIDYNTVRYVHPLM